MTRGHSFYTTWIAEREGLHQQLTMLTSENAATSDLGTSLASGYTTATLLVALFLLLFNMSSIIFYVSRSHCLSLISWIKMCLKF